MACVLFKRLSSRVVIGGNKIAQANLHLSHGFFRFGEWEQNSECQTV